MSKYIYDLISLGENQQLDFKFEISDARKIAKTLVAFANTDGGKLLIGVKDNGRIAGVRSEEEYYMIESAAGLYCKPEVHFTTAKWTIEGKTVLEVDISSGTEKPYYALSHEGKWISYVRVNDQNLLANGIQIKVWQNQSSKKGVYLEYKEAEDLLLKYLNNNGRISFKRFCKLGGISRRKASDILTKMASLDIIDIVFTEKQTFYQLKKKESNN